ncbi:MAG: RluA family pseudouridine synthase [Acidobacteriaceae bacterium]
MPSKNMLPKGKRRKTVMHEYRAQRTLQQEREAQMRADGVEEEVEAGGAAIDTAELMQPSSPFAGIPGLVTSGPSGGKHPQEDKDKTERRYPARKVIVEEREIQVLDDLEAEDGVRSFAAEAAAAGMRLDAYLAKALPEISRARVVLLIEGGQVTVDEKPGKAKQKLKGGEWIEVEGEPQPAPLRATPEDIPLTVVYEDEDLAVVDKPAGMMVHAGSGGEEHNRGTLVNALLHHFGASESKGGLSQVGGALRPGIVHRLDKQTSGLIVVAKNDVTHRQLGEMFSERRLKKTYIALVHGEVKGEEGTIQLPISRDLVRRTRMTTKRAGGRSAVTHWTVMERVNGPYGKFTLLEVRIETGRTHQIRVHMQALGHPVVGDYLYGAPHVIRPVGKTGGGDAAGLTLERNFLHAAALEFAHPGSGKTLTLKAELPEELGGLLEKLRGGVGGGDESAQRTSN